MFFNKNVDFAVYISPLLALSAGLIISYMNTKYMENKEYNVEIYQDKLCLDDKCYKNFYGITYLETYGNVLFALYLASAILLILTIFLGLRYKKIYNILSLITVLVLLASMITLIIFVKTTTTVYIFKAVTFNYDFTTGSIAALLIFSSTILLLLVSNDYVRNLTKKLLGRN